MLGLVGGCLTSKKKETAIFRVHIESSTDPAGTTQQISLLRSDPVLITIKREPILSEANVLSAQVIDAQGGFALQVKFDESGSKLLEQYSAANSGRHFAIYAQWGEKGNEGRWLAAPIISRRITNGTLAFTPDCERDEADKLVAGVNEAARQIRKQMLK